jgi:translocation and assembly module TamA
MQARLFALCCLALSLAGCSLFGHGDDEDKAGGERRPRFRLEVQAPKPLKQLLADNLDLARFREVPEREGLTDEELDRLVAAAPEQARTLLATEGYFSPEVRAAREPGAAGELPRVLVQVEPGPRTRVSQIDLQVQGELQRRAQAGDENARTLLAALRGDWPLKPGEPFRQADWTDAKNATLARLHADGYPTASWLATDAQVRSREQQAQLEARADSGPLFHFGPLRIQGLKRYDEETVRNLAPFGTGAPYSQQQLLDYQDRLQRSGLFEGAVAEIDPDPQKAAATPVTVRVQEQKLQKLTLGLGYETDTGVRATAEHTHRQPFGLRWVAQDKLEAGPDRKAWEFDFRSYPKPGFQRNLVAGNVERWSGVDEDRFAWRLRLGRVWEDPRLERQVYGEFNSARVRDNLGGRRNAQSLSAHYDWTRRDVDSLLLPLRGTALQLQGAVGYARSSTDENGPFARAYGRLFWFHPLPSDWHARVRVEPGQVFARHAVGVPDTLLFRAGGEESVRGYAYRSLGPVVDGVVTSGRALLTASAEAQHPISKRMPQLWGAAFVDAGNAAERFGDLKAKVGVGVGVRYRSPVGPLSVDVAYGVDDRKLRLHLSAGVNF